MGSRLNPKTNQLEPVHHYWYSYLDTLLFDFEHLPHLRTTFGMTVETAMKLPVNHWRVLREKAAAMPPPKSIDSESEVIKLLLSLIRQGGGE